MQEEDGMPDAGNRRIITPKKRWNQISGISRLFISMIKSLTTGETISVFGA